MGIHNIWIFKLTLNQKEDIFAWNLLNLTNVKGRNIFGDN